MDDPLKPKAVPLAAETVLWFEFLLDPKFITRHLKKEHPEPSAVELITQFISMTPETGPQRVGEAVTPGSDLQTMPVVGASVVVGTPTPPLAATGSPVSGQLSPPQTPNLVASVTTAATSTTNVPVDGLHLTRKQLALKILALKTATWLKWNLDLFEQKLHVQMQLFLIRDLCTLSFGHVVTIPFTNDFDMKITSEGNERAARFALTTYHRLILRLQPSKDATLKSARQIINNMYQHSDQMQNFFDTPTQPSVDFLHELCQSNEPYYVFNYETFVTLHPGYEGSAQNYDIMHMISPSELRAQLHYDLANFYLYTMKYQLGRTSAHACIQNLNAARREYQLRNLREKDFRFCHLNPVMLEGLLQACGISEQPQLLLERFNHSLLNGFKDIVEILKLDNHARNIPLVTRRSIELDIEAGISQCVLKEPRTLELQVAALNVVRNIFEWGNIFGSVEYFGKYGELNCYPPIVEAIHDVLPHCNHSDLNALKHFLIDCILHHTNGKQLLKQAHDIGIFTPLELVDLEQQINEEQFPMSALNTLNDWKCNSKLPRIDIGAMERQLIACTNANTVRILLVKLAGTNPSKPLWTVNPSWEIPTPLKSLLIAMQRGFLQDFAYVILGKARELTAKGDYIGAVSMLSVLKSETQRHELSSVQLVGKLGKLVNWEILHIQITQSLEEWHQKPLDLQSLATRCKQCLASLQNGDNVIPRIEIIENCTMMLLNLTEWQALMFLDKRLPQLELPLSYAATFLEMEKMKGPKKICRDAWDLVLSMFLNTTKRNGPGGGPGGGGSGGGSSRNSPCLAVSTALQPFLKRLRHQSLFGLAISILGKIHNILKDDPNHDLSCEYMQVWPTTISNPISYSLRSVCETLQWLLTEALKFYPQTISWLKMKGDLELAIGNNEAAMRCYVNALVTGTDYCTMQLQRNIADDYIIRKMIRCAANLGCHMQATVLCQFLSEIDYGIVFKNLSEKSSNFTDAMDAYYSCIWDTTLLEFIINLHAKRGEHSRKLEAINIMGTLELNANNNDEIRCEAAAIRKARFLRALAKQYLL